MTAVDNKPYVLIHSLPVSPSVINKRMLVRQILFTSHSADLC